MPLYRIWLHLYPASFRSEYGDEMCAIFAQKQRNTSGRLAWFALWMSTFFEIAFNAAAVHAEILRQDLGYTARALGRSPGFALTAILVLALGVGANTAAFSLTDHVLIRPLPFRDAGRLVKLWEDVPGYNRMELSPPNYRDWQRLSTSFEGMGAFATFPVNFTGEGQPERVERAVVTAELFRLLGSQPVLGRLFTPADDQESSPATILLSHQFWQTRFGGDPGVLGRRVRLDNIPFTIIGVMPPGFYFPSRETELWMPFRNLAQDPDRTNNYLQVLAKLKPGVSLTAARTEMRLIAAQLEHAYPKENLRTSATVIGLRDELSAQSRMLLLALSGAAICVLLIACTNLANLQLARSLARHKELAVRTALGAGRERLVRHLLTDGLLLTALGGALGLLLGILVLPLLAELVPNALPVAQSPSIDWRVLGAAALLTALTGIGFGVIPAWRVCRRSDLSGLRESAPSRGGPREGLRSALVIAEVAATTILLVSSGLFLRALWKLHAVDPGFRPEGVLTLQTALPDETYAKTDMRVAFYRRVLSEIRSLPQVINAAYISFLPMTMTGGIWPVSVNGGEPQIGAGNDTASLRFVTPGLFAALGISWRLGRDVSESDTLEGPPVAVVSESFVQRYWPNDNPLGHHFRFAFADREVVGVVGDIRVRGLERSSEPQVYLPYRQVPDGALIGYSPKDLVVRSSGDPLRLVPAIRRIVGSCDPQQPVSNVRMLRDIVEAQTAPRAVQMRVLGAFAALALLLAAIGIHGVLSFAVSRRAREIGVRIALGARPSDVVAMVICRGSLLAAAGALPGLVLAYAAGRALEALLAGVKPGDGTTFTVAACLCIVMALPGSLLPALRAVRMDPISVIRAE
jgi:predicted permease